MTQQTADLPDGTRPSWPRRHQDDGGCDLFKIGALVDCRYRVVRPIGRGGMGRILEIARLADCARLALKYCEGTPLGKKRLAREAKILGSINHPHVLTIMDVNFAHDPPYYVMPLAVETLEAELPLHGGKLDWALTVFRQICLGVHALHQAGVVHRDLKPANVLRLADDRHVVADLGTAKREPRDSTILTRTCAILGTLCYLAPEQLMPGGSRHADARTDVFQLGKVFYQMMTKRSPAVIDPAALPPGLAHIVTRATAARPADRYADVLALLQAVEGYENSERDRDSPRSILEHLTQRIDKLAEAGVPGEASGQAILEALAGLDWVQEDDFLEGFDRVPVNVLASLARQPHPIIHAPFELRSEPRAGGCAPALPLCRPRRPAHAGRFSIIS